MDKLIYSLNTFIIYIVHVNTGHAYCQPVCLLSLIKYARWPRNAKLVYTRVSHLAL